MKNYIMLILIIAGLSNTYSMETPHFKIDQDQLNKEFFTAIVEKNKDKVEEALAKGADINALSKYSWDIKIRPGFALTGNASALSVALDFFNPEIIKILTEYGADINKAESGKNIPIFNIIWSIASHKIGYTEDKYSRALYERYLDKLKSLVNVPLINLEVTNKQNETPLEYAKKLNLPEDAKILIEAIAKRKGVKDR